MGQQALASVADRSIDSVVEGLLGWYRRGIASRLATPAAARALKLLMLLLVTPMSILVLAVYDVVVSCVVVFTGGSLVKHV